MAHSILAKPTVALDGIYARRSLSHKPLGDTAGWQIDGPTYPEKTGERQYTNRWVRFKNEDVGRFYRDFLEDDVKKRT